MTVRPMPMQKASGQKWKLISAAQNVTRDHMTWRVNFGGESLL